MPKKCHLHLTTMVKTYEDEDSFTYSCPVNTCNYSVYQRKRKPAYRSKLRNSMRKAQNELYTMSAWIKNEYFMEGLAVKQRELLSQAKEWLKEERENEKK